MTPAECLEACRQLSDRHGFIVTESQHLCRHSDGGVSNCPEYRVTVFNLDHEIVHTASSRFAFDDIVEDVRDFLNQPKATTP